MSSTTTLEQDARRPRTVRWVIVLATVGMVFDGYDLVIYGAVLSTFLGDPGQIGEVTPALAGVTDSLDRLAAVEAAHAAYVAWRRTDVTERTSLLQRIADT